jgi:DNA-binding beta-propeller fold protein YncE
MNLERSSPSDRVKRWPTGLGAALVIAGATRCGATAQPSASPPPPPAAASADAAIPAANAPPSEVADASAPSAQTDASGPKPLAARTLALPGTAGHATLDYLLYEPTHERVWIPVGETGSVDVLDPASGQFTSIAGFKTVEVPERKRTLGPSSATAGEGFVYVGDRASSEVCAIDAATLKLARCLKLATAPDGLAYVAATKEIWATTPRDTSITVLDASTPGSPRPKATIRLPGAPEGYAVDDEHRLFWTNLEDKNQTLAIDVARRKVRSTWPSGCGSDGPRGVAVDSAERVVMVACTDQVVLLDDAHDGAPLGSIAAGAGIDNIAWVPARRLLYIAAAKAATLTVARVESGGTSVIVARASTDESARNAVVDARGNAYLADAAHGAVQVVEFDRLP